VIQKRLSENEALLDCVTSKENNRHYTRWTVISSGAICGCRSR